MPPSASRAMSSCTPRTMPSCTPRTMSSCTPRTANDCRRAPLEPCRRLLPEPVVVTPRIYCRAPLEPCRRALFCRAVSSCTPRTMSSCTCEQCHRAPAIRSALANLLVAPPRPCRAPANDVIVDPQAVVHSRNLLVAP
jgi:hypothetical protein